MIASALDAVGDVLSSSTMYESMMRFAIVLAFAAVGEWVAERAGTLNISLEAMLIAGVFTGAVVYDTTGSTAAGLAAGSVAGGLVALAQGNLSHRLATDQFVVGLTLNLLVLGLALFLDGEFEPVTWSPASSRSRCCPTCHSSARRCSANRGRCT